jgi:DNA-binding XRE family transcriptional regulator
MGWTQTDAAAWAGVDLRTWRRWETGQYQPHGLLPRAMQSLPANVQAQLHLF